MNGRYALARTRGERMAIAVVAANQDFVQAHGSGKLPTAEFYEDYLEPFIERELRQAQLDEIHLQTGGPIRRRELEVVDSLRYWNRLCEERVNASGKQKEGGKS